MMQSYKRTTDRGGLHGSQSSLDAAFAMLAKVFVQFKVLDLLEELIKKRFVFLDENCSALDL